MKSRGRMRALACVAITVAVVLLLPRDGSAQATSGGIAGVAKDATGAVLPGVTVEAASPALIEKVRVVVTDAEGQYKIVDLRPGTYAVTFTLPGFSTYKRDGLELTTGFTATANAEMKVGSLEETITVTGASPVVDVQNVNRREVLVREVLDTLPTGKTIQGYASLSFAAVVPPNAQDVGGNTGEFATGMGVHGGRPGELKLQLDGMNFNQASGTGSGGSRNFVINQVSTQEVVLDSDNMSVETESGGVQLNIVPKEGGNTFKVYGIANGTNSSLQAVNMSDALRARGLISGTPVKKVYDFGFGLGGPVKKDRLWFYSGNRWWGAQQTFGGIAGGYFNKNHGVYVGAPNSGVSIYAPDFTRQSYNDRHNQDNNVRLTWQVAAKHKISAAGYTQDDCSCFALSTGRAPDATSMNHWHPVYMVQSTWTSPLTNRLLLQAGAMHFRTHNNSGPAPGVTPTDIGIADQSLGIDYNAGFGVAYSIQNNTIENQRFSLSYVTGSHAFKAGFLLQESVNLEDTARNQSLNYTFVTSGVPSSITQWAYPFPHREKLAPGLGLYVSDQWTVRRLTMTVGARFDYIHEYVPAISIAAGRFAPARTYPKLDNVPNWKDVSTRYGAAYDLSGDGKTALKAFIGRFVQTEATGVAAANGPFTSTVLSAARTWADANGNYVPDCDLTVSTVNGECGALNNSNFGKTIVTTTWDPSLLSGWGKRPFSYQASLALQRELRPGMGLVVGYYRRWFGNFTTTDNLAVTPGDFTQYCVTAPVDSRLPGGGGNQLCGLADVNPSKFGQVQNLVTLASNFGKQIEHYNGFDVGVNMRFGRGGLISGGVNTAKTITDNCFVVDSPQQARPGFCHTENPWSHQAQSKFAVNYPMRWGLQASGTIQSLPGVNITANRTYRNAEILPSLGRNLASGANGTATLAVLEPFNLREDRINQIDTRLTKTFRLKRTSIKTMFDLYNILNANSVLDENFTYGAAWLQPRTILGGRLFKFGVQVDM